MKKNKQLIFGLFIVQFELICAKNIFCYLSVALKEKKKNNDESRCIAKNTRKAFISRDVTIALMMQGIMKSIRNNVFCQYLFYIKALHSVLHA